jgi:hypothetical protein
VFLAIFISLNSIKMGQAKSKMNGGKQKGRKKQAKADVEIAK